MPRPGSPKHPREDEEGKGRLVLLLIDENAVPLTAPSWASVTGVESHKRGSARGGAGEVTRFVFELSPGDYAVEARAEGFGDAGLEVSVVAGQEINLRVPLQSARPGEREGGEEGEGGLVDARFEAFARARTDRGGEFPVEGREKALREKGRMLDPDVVNRPLRVTRVAAPLPGSSFGDVGAWVRVAARKGTFQRSLLKIAYDPDTLGWVDPSSVRVFAYDARRKGLTLARDSGADPERSAAWAYVDRPGVYGVIGLPSDDRVLEVVRALCRVGPDATTGGKATLSLCERYLCGEQARDLTPPGGGDACGFCRNLSVPPGGLPECDLLDDRGGPPPGPPPLGPCSWLSVGPRNINGRVRAMAVHPNVGGTVFAGTANAGVWSTADSGQTWTPLMFREGALEIGALAVHVTDPANPTGDITIYAGTGEPTSWPGYKGIGILKSTTSGAPGSWAITGAIPSPGGDRFAAIAVDIATVSANPATTVLWAGGPGGLFKSTNGGGAWTPVQILGVTKSIEDIALDPTNPGIVYVAVPFEGIYRFDPGTSVWSAFNTGISSFPQLGRIAIGQSAPHTIYAKLDQAVYRYNTLTSAWQSLGNHAGNTYGYWNNFLGVDPQDSNIVVVGGYSVERTPDGGTNWQTPSVGHEDQHAVAFDSGNHLTVWVGNDGGVFQGTHATPPSLATWTKRSNGLTISHLNSLGGSTAGSDLVGAGVQDNGSIRTTGGLTWDSVMGGDGSDYLIDPADPHLMYAQLTTIGVNSHPYKSTNGSSFAPADAGFADGPFVGKMILDPNSPAEPNRVLFAAGTDRVMRSTNSAGGWAASSPALSGEPTALALAPSSSAILYAGSSGGQVWRSSDGGATLAGWKNVTIGTIGGSATLPGRGVSDIVVHPSDPATVFVAFSGFNGAPLRHVYRGNSADGYVTWSWQDVSSNLPDIPVNALEIDPAASTTLWAGTDTGVFRTTDGGLSWAPFDTGLPNIVIADLRLNPAGDVLRAAAYGYSSWEIHLGSTCPQVDQYVRDNKLDTGEEAALSWVPDPTALGESVYWWESVDEKTDAFPYAPPPIDGVDFDRFTHENPVRNDAAHPNPNRLYVQVHNRGPQPAHNVRVKALWADATLAVPPLPTDFWSSFPNTWSAASPWSEVDAAQPFQPIAVLQPHTPKVLTWSFTVPPTAAEHSCVLVVVSSDEDAPSRSDANVNDHDVSQVAPNDKHVALKNLKVVDGASPPPGGGAPPAGGGGPLAARIDLVNPGGHPGYFDVVFDRGTLPRGTRVSLLLPAIKTRMRIGEGGQVPMRKTSGRGGWWASALKGSPVRGLKYEFRLSEGLVRDPCTGRELAEVPGVLLRVGERLRGALVFKLGGGLKPGAACRCALLQRSGGRLVGGHTFEIRIPPRDRMVRS